MKLIPLTQGLFTQVDDYNYDWLNQWKWYALKNGHTYYAVRRIKGDNRKSIYMHRLILDVLKEKNTDHIDHNGLNNQELNLRDCTQSQNSKNKTARGNSKYLGVCYTCRGLIVANIDIEKHLKYLGQFKTEELAARAYDEAAKIYHGEFANLNFK